MDGGAEIVLMDERSEIALREGRADMLLMGWKSVYVLLRDEISELVCT